MPTTTRSARFPHYTGAAQATGRKPTQEDAFAVQMVRTADNREAYLLLVADGVGGAQAGERASARAATVAPELLGQADFTFSGAAEALRAALSAAGRAILDQSYKNVDWHGMSTTCTAVLVQGDRLVLAHVGDSRAYYCDRAGHMTPLTVDHTWAEEAIAAGRSPEEMRNHPNANTITRYLGVDERVEVDTRLRWPGNGDLVDCRQEPLALDGGQVMLCSDGVSDVLSPEQMAATLRAYPAGRAAQQLVKQALAAGASDNVTVAVLDLDKKAKGKLAVPRWAKVAAPVALALVLLLVAWQVWGQSLLGSGPAERKTSASALPVNKPGAVEGETGAGAGLMLVIPGAAPGDMATLAPAPTPVEPGAASGEGGDAPAVAARPGTAAPVATVNATPDSAGFALVAPGQEATVQSVPFELQWRFRTLREGEVYVVTYLLEGRAQQQAETREPRLQLSPDIAAHGKYYWQVSVQRRVGDGWVTVAQSPLWAFWLAPQSSGGGGAGGAVGKTAAPTAVVAPSATQPGPTAAPGPTATPGPPTATPLQIYQQTATALMWTKVPTTPPLATDTPVPPPPATDTPVPPPPATDTPVPPPPATDTPVPPPPATDTPVPPPPATDTPVPPPPATDTPVPPPPATDTSVPDAPERDAGGGG
jgi:serine/threonine protein phosphatase PrpC